MICQNYGHPNIDLFTTCYNHPLQMLVSPLPDALALDHDALIIGENGLHAYLFRPPSLCSPETGIQSDHPDCLGCILLAQSDVMTISAPTRWRAILKTISQSTQKSTPMPRVVGSKCVVHSQKALTDGVFSMAAALASCQTHRPSTASLYAQKWLFFKAYCPQHDMYHIYQAVPICQLCVKSLTCSSALPILPILPLLLNLPLGYRH